MEKSREVFQSVKVIDGFSTCFRQWRADGTHCKFLHGYGISFKVTFEGDLDFRNWVMDFGFMKRAKTTISIPSQQLFLKPDEWFKYMFDHTTVIAKSDPELDWYLEASKRKILQLRLLDEVGCELFAKLVSDTLNTFLMIETDGKVKVVEVECFEHNKNSAIYKNIIK